jgi:hypothetical protein
MLRERLNFPVPIVRLLDVWRNVIWLVLCTHPEILAVSISSDSETLVPFYETRRRHILKCHHVDCKQRINLKSRISSISPAKMLIIKDWTFTSLRKFSKCQSWFGCVQKRRYDRTDASGLYEAVIKLVCAWSKTITAALLKIQVCWDVNV